MQDDFKLEKLSEKVSGANEEPSQNVDTYQEIRDRICVMRYPPGTILRETDLAKEFGMSRTPIREILQRLQYEGLLESRKGLGTIVKGLSAEAVRDVYEVRIKVVEWAADFARPFTKADIDKLRQLMKRCDRLGASVDVEEFWRINNELHEVQANVIENNTLKGLCYLLYYQTNRHWFHALHKMWDENVLAMHSQIEQEILAMENGDTRGAFLVRRNFIVTYYNRGLEWGENEKIGKEQNQHGIGSVVDFKKVAFKLR